MSKFEKWFKAQFKSYSKESNRPMYDIWRELVDARRLVSKLEREHHDAALAMECKRVAQYTNNAAKNDYKF